MSIFTPLEKYCSFEPFQKNNGKLSSEEELTEESSESGAAGSYIEDGFDMSD